MLVTDLPELTFAYRHNIFSDDALSFIGELEKLAPDTIVGYLSGKLQATTGVWVRVGHYRLANGSFIDPSDLMLYVEQYYSPEDDGPIEALELNHGESAPVDAYAASTIDELLDALVKIDLAAEQPAEDGVNADEAVPEEAAVEAESPAVVLQVQESLEGGVVGDPDGGVAAEATAGPEADDAAEPAMEPAADDAEEPAESLPPSRFDGMTIVEPAGAFEMHGALTSGWHAMYYEAADGSSLLVFD